MYVNEQEQIKDMHTDRLG